MAPEESGADSGVVGVDSPERNRPVTSPPPPTAYVSPVDKYSERTRGSIVRPTGSAHDGSHHFTGYKVGALELPRWCGLSD